jgi:AcrR family transcriptional regulator
MSEPVKRRYDARRRQEQARANELAVLQAASRLFLERGYGRTTLSAVAEQAGVSVETVYARFGSKTALLHRVWDLTIGGDDQDVPYHQRPEVQALQAEPDLARRLQLQAELFTRTAHRTAPFLLMVQSAAGADPAAALMMEEMGRQRLAGITVMAHAAAATGQLAVPEDVCRDIIWSLTDGVLWHRLVQERGWTDQQFTAHLAQLWIATLLPPAAR